MTVTQFHQLVSLLISITLPELSPDTEGRYTGPIVYTGQLENGFVVIARLWEGEKDGGLVCEVRENWQSPCPMFTTGADGGYWFSGRRPWSSQVEALASWLTNTRVIFGGQDHVVRLNGVDETIRALRQLRQAIDRLKTLDSPPGKRINYPSE